MVPSPKRDRNDLEEDGDISDDEKGKRRKKDDPDPSNRSGKRPLQLKCPFFANDPMKYSNQSGSSPNLRLCGSAKITTISRLKSV